MNISAWAMRRPIVPIVLFLAMMALGLLSFSKLPINAEPSAAYPIVNITVTQSGAAPDELENSVTRRIEDAVAGLIGVRHITSSITSGTSLCTVEFEFGTDLDRAANDVRDAVSRVRSDLPASIDSPVVTREDSEGGALAYYALESANRDQTDLVWFADEVIGRSLLAQKGVSKVRRMGGEKREIRVELNAARLRALGLTAEQVHTLLAQGNVNRPGGTLQQDGSEKPIRVIGARRSVQELSQMPVAVGSGGTVRLGQIASVSDSHAVRSSLSRLDSREVVGFAVYRAKGHSDTAVAARVQQTLDKIGRDNPDVRIREIHSAVSNTLESYEAAMSALVEGMLITVLVVFAFLRGWRPTLVAAITLPLSILPAFAVIHWLGYTLNSISLLAIMLVVGVLVDDAIVEIENIQRHIQTGKRPFRAAFDASSSLAFAVTAISATIVAVFLPVSFIDGFTGLYFRQFGITVSVAVISSWLAARTIVPVLAAYLLRPYTGDRHVRRGLLRRLYLSALSIALRHRLACVCLALCLLAGSAGIVAMLPTGFLPKSDTGLTQVDFELPAGSSIEQTDRVLSRAAGMLQGHRAVQSVFSTAGSDSEPAKGQLLVRLKPHKERDLTQKEFEDKFRSMLVSIPDARFVFKNDMAARDVSVMLTGNDPQTLVQTARTLRTQMQSIRCLANVQIVAPAQSPDLRVRLKPAQAAGRGVTAESLGNLLQIATVGDIGGKAAYFDLPDRQIPIRVVLRAADRSNPDAVGHLLVPGASGAAVPLNAVAAIEPGASPTRIDRFDRERVISVQADLAAGYSLGEALGELSELEVLGNLPPGVSLHDSDEAQSMDEMFGEFGAAIAWGVLAMALILIIMFGDFLQPLTILIALPLSIGGAAAGLLAWGRCLDMSSVIGILLLLGIVAKNSILLVDFVIEKRKAGAGRTAALISSGSERVRPIMMTTLAMSAGMLPALFATGAGAAFREPMAIALIAGLISSTLLSLVFVPVMYALVDDLNIALGRILGRYTSVTQQDRREVEHLPEDK